MRLLIVDDSNFIREFLKQNLRWLDACCAEAGDGLAALEVLRSSRGFDLMLVDVNMPGMDGLECVKTLRREGLGSGMKVMMVTTEVDSSFIRRALDSGADEFLMKPFTPQVLREKLLLMGFGLAA